MALVGQNALRTLFEGGMTKFTYPRIAAEPSRVIHGKYHGGRRLAAGYDPFQTTVGRKSTPRIRIMESGPCALAKVTKQS